MEEFLLILLFLTSLVISISSLDDLFIDLLATGISHFKETPKELVDEHKLPPIAVFVANWQEEAVLEKMVLGNLSRITNPAVMIYLGVYPNDTDTLNIALGLAEKYPERVKTIVNSLPGPTSKGQMLNEMFKQVFSDSEICPELMILHDSEDLIDPRTFSLYASFAANGYDFIQVPVVLTS